MNRLQAVTRRAAWTAFLPFAAVLLLVAPAEASVPRSAGVDQVDAVALASLERPALGLASPTLEPSGFSLGEDLSVFDTTNAQGALGLCGLETSRCALTYARNNPVNVIDPDGRLANPIQWIGQQVSALHQAIDELFRGQHASLTPVVRSNDPNLQALSDPSVGNTPEQSGRLADASGAFDRARGDALATVSSEFTKSAVDQVLIAGVAGATRSAARGLWTISEEASAGRLVSGKFTFVKHESTGLWWSRDGANHGGSAWKVFRETGRGLEWKWDADKYGDIITGKHKSPIGTFFSWKDLH